MAQAVNELIASYLASTPAASRATYRRVMGMWLRWCADNDVSVLGVRRVHIDAYRIWRIERLGRQPGSVAGELVPICGFYSYLWQERIIERNPAEHVKRPKLRRWSDGSWLTDEQASRFLHLAEQDRRPFVGAACALMLLSGLRVGETLALDVGDYYHVSDMPVVHVRRKFDWMQEIGIPERCATASDRAKGERGDGPLLVYRGRRVRNATINGIVVKLGERCGAERRITPHSLRRTFATTARAHGVPDREIMASGGWSTREMLDRYDMGRLAVSNTASRTVANALEEVSDDDER